MRGYGPLEAGIRLVPLALGFMAGAGMSDRMVVRLGTKAVVTGGLFVIGGTLAAFAFLDGATAYWVIGTQLFVLGAGMGATMAPATDAMMGSVPEANAGVGSALNDVTRNVGGALGVGILGSILNSVYSSNIGGAVTQLPVEAAAAAKNSIGAAAQLADGLSGPSGEALNLSAANAFIDGFGVAMAVVAAITFAGALIVFRFMPARESSDEIELELEREKRLPTQQEELSPVPAGLDD